MPPIADEMSDSALRMTNISLTFADGTQALDNVNLNIQSGEFVTIVGPSGCGKSTLLRLASGLLAQTQGLCDVDRTSLGYVFQDPTLLPWRTVRRNVELNAELAGMDKPSRQKAANAAIELVNLTGNEDKYPKQLSGGMKMRCSLARSLVLQPNLFLFDEPFAALDEITREHLNDELLHLYQNQHFASLFITHSIQEAVFLSTRVLVMSARPGRIIAEHAIDFPYPRHPDIRYQSDFAEICGKISADLKVAHS
ncbi:MAG: ABC transporter ATP-binding protein [Ilumatobacteraceae bacterium]|nr:ABC transporter ATP-binding protein [Ilumatobacteraceae bacterium]